MAPSSVVIGVAPPAAGAVQARDRIVRLLQRAAGFPITIVEAPPGYGKTIALRAFAAHEGSRVRFVDVTGLAPAAALEALRAAAAAPMAGTLPGCLIADGLGAWNDPGAARALYRLVEATLAQFGWILSGRVLPAPPLASWLADGLLGHLVGPEALAFSADEIVAFHALFGDACTPDDALMLVRETGGWPAGVALARAVSAGADRRTVYRNRAERYFDERLLSRLAPSQRRALEIGSRYALLDPAAVSASGLEDVAAELDALARCGDFVTRLEDGTLVIAPPLRRQILLQSARSGDAPALLRLSSAASAPAGRLDPAAGGLAALTATEVRVIRELSTGATSAEAAQTFGRSVNTVNTHVKSILRKLNCASRRDAIRIARTAGITP